jgi:hypothetical protein
LAPRKDTRELIGELVQSVNNIPLFMTGNPSFFEDIKSKGSIIFVNNPRQLEVELDKLSAY